jgi:hypothetical protein
VASKAVHYDVITTLSRNRNAVITTLAESPP